MNQDKAQKMRFTIYWRIGITEPTSEPTHHE